MKLKYIPFFTEDMEEQVKFFTEKLRFKVVNNNSLHHNTPGTILQNAEDEMMIAIAETRHYRPNKNLIILCTDDCLKDYHRLKTEGLNFTKEPHYLPLGLVAEFVDQNDNRFMLIEERNYNEDI
jgi:predicted enzyme related to lactoylglutathione lyase